MRAYVRLVLIAVLGLLGAGLAPTSVHAAGTGSIAGTITAEGGSPLGSVKVTVYRWNGMWATWSWAAETTTDAEGAYALTGLDPATYRVGFVDPTNRHFAEFFDNEKSVDVATDVPVSEAVLAHVVDAELARTARITGAVTKGAAQAASGIQVVAYRWVEPTYSGSYGYWGYVAGTTTDAAGTYDLVGLDTGDYRVKLTDNSGELAPEWWDDSLTVTTAKPVELTRGQTAGSVDAHLVPASHIAGRVTTLSGQPAEGLPVAVYERDAVSGFWTALAYARTNSAGQYDIGRLAAGTYRVGVPGPDGVQGQSEYLEQYWPTSATLVNAGDLVVGAAATRSGTDLTVVRPARLTGTLRDVSGAPVPNLQVRPYRWDASASTWESVSGYFWTNASGQYAVTGLRAGRYTLFFEPPWPSSAHLETWWGPSPDRAGAVALDIANEEIRSGLDMTIEAGSSISGTVRTTSSQPLAQVRVIAQRRSLQGGWAEVATDWTDADGTYELTGLMSGTYRIGFQTGGYVATWWGGGSSLETATDVILGADSAQTGKHALMAPIPDPTPVPTSPPTPSPTATTPAPTTTPTTPPPTPDVASQLTAVAKELAISGKPLVGKTVRIKGLVAQLRSKVGYRFQWYAGSAKIAKATKSSLKVTKAMKRKVLKVKVTLSADGASKVVTIKVGKVA